MVLSEKFKNVVFDMIYDLDSHFPTEILTDEYYLWFYNKYIIPINEEYKNQIKGE